MNLKDFKILVPSLLTAAILTGCGSDSEFAAPPPSNPPSTPPETEAPAATPFTIGLLPDTQGGSDSEGQAHVSMYPMREVLAHQAAAGVDMVIAVGDLTDNGSDIEFAEWRSIADAYAEQGIEFLPVMGNHETSYAYTYNWIENMRNFIPEDAVHMPDYEWINYYVVRDNVLIFGLAYYNLPIAYSWLKETVESMEGIDHIVVASHDGLIGAKYGQTREQIVDGTKGDDWVFSVQPQIREFFADHDVIYVQGHEHQYQRSLISAKTALTTTPSSSTPTGGNYRMDTYTQIMAGNASYKGYEFRYGERELVQMIVAQKNATMSKGSSHFDVNSSLLTFTDQRIDYASYFAPHTATSNDADQDFTAQWHLMDKFSRTKNRCESVIYPNSIPADTRPVLVLQTQYMTNDCYGDDGSYVNLVGGQNNTFNRTDTRTRDMSFTPGFTRAETMNDLIRLNYQWLYQVHESWTPNLNSPVRVIPDYDANELIIPETTIDLKEHVTLSWLPANETASDILIISGTQNQTGVYQDDYGVLKNIEADTGLSNSQPDGSAKSAITLPPTATQDWDISSAVSDTFAVQFTAPEALDSAALTLGILRDGEWQAITPDNCIIDSAWSTSYLSDTPARNQDCAGTPLVGYDSSFGNRWWVVLNADAEIALIAQ
ncbi:metallophosphoesterase family protein [Alteromonas gilva]|uniref:Metallophosphoesterase n=1 Tax=Alteromonas gilva TaxID=2987522 RepID=A0ABT5L4K4_9ALTE|nr:metallophosphoesterase [Alteromonas gilva]MDC8831431.1 metallophosphoesterase [Alteromonas gilva]